MNKQKFTLTYPWDENGYKPYTEFELDVSETGFLMRVMVHEDNPRRVETEHQHYVHKDSCVEWFVNFAPMICDRYFNFEVNANGAMHVAFRKDRYEGVLLTEEEIRTLKITTKINDSNWAICFRVPFVLIKKYIPQYCYEKGMKIRTNFYKCGDNTEFPHYGIWTKYPLEKPDFHRPEYFGEITV
ncbi:MAG: hypothetical protein IJZ85_02900 [Lachnospiraceae bacterium]|nr:hypothetical protein [Lachnospiraceae bacterium]